MTYLKRLLLFILFAGSTGTLFAQISIDLDMRSRAGYWNGYQTLPTSETNPATIISHRSRMIFNYSSDKITGKLTLQDGRVWGESNTNSNSIHEAWIDYKFTKTISLRIGRQILSYDNKRLLAASNWSVTDISHDIALFKYKKDDFEAHLGYAVYNNGTPASKFLEQYIGGTFNTKSLAFLWLKKPFLDKKLNVSFMGIMDGSQQIITDINGNSIINPEQVNYRYTFGPYIKYKQDKLLLSVQYYLQTGKTVFDQDIKADLLGLLADYSFTKTFSLSAGYDYLSGTDYGPNNTSTENNTFCKIYGSGHIFLGYLDYFGTPSKHGAGLNDIFVKAKGKLPLGIVYKVAYHNFSLDKEYLKTGEKVDKALGSEIDIVLSYKLSKSASIATGYSTYFTTESIEKIKNITVGTSETPSFAYVQLIFTPEIFKQ